MIGPEHLQILQPLGADQATFVARETSTGEARLVVVERVTRASPVPAARAELLRRGRALRALEHPKVVRVHDVFERDGEVLVVSDYVDGEWLSSLMMMSPKAPLGVSLRLVVDVLEGLGALHALQDDRDQIIGFVHGAIAPDTILVADDGVAEIARACRLPRAGMNERYVAPELRRGGDSPPDPRSDIYAAGAILRDVLADAAEGESWGESLTDIAWRACSVDEENRWPTAAAMATAIRRIAGPRLATAAATAEFVRKRFGAKMQARRQGFEAQRDSAPPSSVEPMSIKPSEMELMDASEPTLAGGKTPPLPLVYPAAPPAQPPPAPAPARASLTKKPMLLLEAQAPDPLDSKEPETRRRPPVTPLGLAPVAPQRASGAPAPSPLLTPAPPAVSLPPPTIVPDEAAVSEQYRKRLPTFPTMEPGPPRRRVATQGVVVAGAMIATFAVGWWLGRTSTPPVQSPSAASASAPAALAGVVPTSSAAPPSVPTAEAVPAASSATIAASAPSASAPAPSSAPVAVNHPTWSSGASTGVVTPAVPVATTAPSRPVQDPATTAPRPAPAASVAAAPSAEPQKPVSKPAGYVPDEL